MPKQSKLKIRQNSGVVKHNPLKELTNEKFIDAAILECLKNNDPEGAMEVLRIYMDALNRTKVKLFTGSKLAKTTGYHSLRSKNPTLKTFSKLMHATHQETNRLTSPP